MEERRREEATRYPTCRSLSRSRFSQNSAILKLSTLLHRAAPGSAIARSTALHKPQVCAHTRKFIDLWPDDTGPLRLGTAGRTFRPLSPNLDF